MFAEEADVSNAGKTQPEERIIEIVSKDKEAKNSRPPFKNVHPFYEQSAQAHHDNTGKQHGLLAVDD